MALAAAVHYNYRPRAGGAVSESRNVANTEVIYTGALVCTNATGLLVNLADTAAFTFKGIATQTVTGDTSATRPTACIVNTRGDSIELAAITGATGVADIGDKVYATDENTFTKSATTNLGHIGIIQDYDGANFFVQLLSAPEYAATL